MPSGIAAALRLRSLCGHLQRNPMAAAPQPTATEVAAALQQEGKRHTIRLVVALDAPTDATVRTMAARFGISRAACCRALIEAGARAWQ